MSYSNYYPGIHPEGQENYVKSCQGTRRPAEIRTKHFSNRSCFLGSNFMLRRLKVDEVSERVARTRVEVCTSYRILCRWEDSIKIIL
jgi:hypothetical protein